MRIAVFSDVHANIQALRNVLTDIRAQKPDMVCCLGDLVGYGPRPNEAVALLKEMETPTIMGNYDDGVGNERGDCGCAYVTPVDKANGQKSIDWTTAAVTADYKKYLRGLRSEIRLEAGGHRVLMVHGSPRRINEYLHADRPEASLRRLLEPLDVDVLVCGHTHVPYHRVVDGVHVVNDGSVGKPKDGDPRACYALITLGDEVEVEFRRVEYPVEQVMAEIVEAGLPPVFAEALKTGG
ncbi:metallophosphoesterase family protein [Candidatus Bathyarchaeota archaeon]|nr:metallophosphoesterase family protein [Candidatus Bathyarchaeota archaeon]